MKNRFVVMMGSKRWPHDKLDAAVAHAKRTANIAAMGVVIGVWDAQRNVTVGVYTDDADGLVFHVFSWPADVPWFDHTQIPLDSAPTPGKV